MVINRHGSFYIRNGWVTKMIEAITRDHYIFTPNNEQKAIDSIGLGRIMIKALRYWSVALCLTNEIKTPRGIEHVPTEIMNVIEEYDQYCILKGTLLLLHRNLILNIDEATAWYWFFNEWNSKTISKDDFVDCFHSYLSVNGINVGKSAIEKEFNCLRNTYSYDRVTNIKTIMDEDTIPFFAPVSVVSTDKNKNIVKESVNIDDLSIELLIYMIAMDNFTAASNKGQVSIETLLEDKCQIGKYFNLDYSSLIEALVKADNLGYIKLINNFGNSLIEFTEQDYNELLLEYYRERD